MTEHTEQTTTEPYRCFIQGQLFEIADDMMDGLCKYIVHGIRPGSFMTAVLENDLAKATELADVRNILILPAYASFLVNKAPGACWGSPEKVNRWIEMKREARQHGD